MIQDLDWSYFNPVRIYSGSRVLENLSTLLPEGRGLLVTSPGFTSRGLTANLRANLGPERLAIVDDVAPNPDIKAIENKWREYAGQNFQFVLGIGGGSVLDTAKALSYLLCTDEAHFSLEHHFVSGSALPESSLPLKMFAVPTTAGTGSEVTPFATIWDARRKKKYSLSTPELYPDTALLDPCLSLTLPVETTIISGLDALSHALESAWNRNANPMSLNFAARAVGLVLHYLPLLVQEPHNLDWRNRMLQAGLFGGLCISSTRTAFAHSMSYPLTARLGVPHGMACSFTLPALLEFNAAEDDGRLEELSRLAGRCNVSELYTDLLVFFEKVKVHDLVLQYGLTMDRVAELIPEMYTPGRADNNMRAAGAEELYQILSKSCASP